MADKWASIVYDSETKSIVGVFDEHNDAKALVKALTLDDLKQYIADKEKELKSAKKPPKNLKETIDMLNMHLQLMTADRMPPMVQKDDKTVMKYLVYTVKCNGLLDNRIVLR
jgi:hypothetical protein